jgi:hypothetical protein
MLLPPTNIANNTMAAMKELSSPRSSSMYEPASWSEPIILRIARGGDLGITCSVRAATRPRPMRRARRRC